MTRAEDIEKKIEQINLKSTPEMRNRILSEASQAMEQTINASAEQPSVWRIIMRSKMSKFAVSAVVLVAVVLSIIFLDKTVTPAYAMTDVPELFRQANVIHVKGLLHFNLMDKGQKVLPQPIERWIDLENGRFRSSSITVYAGPDEVKFSREETISDGQYKMVINHADKSVIFYEMSDLQCLIKTHKNFNHLFFGRFFPDSDILKEFSVIGKEKIDGIKYNIWECKVQESPRRTNRYKYWLSDSGSSGRFQTWYKNNQESWKPGYDYHKIECNVPIPEHVFKLEVPEGYEAKNTKENAICLVLGGQNGTYFGNLNLKPRVSFTLADGSVILAWQSGDSQSLALQDELFEDLEFGGALPKLPIEISGLEPTGWTWTGNTKYLGRHLAYTQKNGEYIEWSLYVPDNQVPTRKQILGYDLIFDFNLENEPKNTMQLMVGYGISIETSEDFDKWVLGAMVELSDDEMIPEGITYDRVLELAQQIRELYNE